MFARFRARLRAHKNIATSSTVTEQTSPNPVHPTTEPRAVAFAVPCRSDHTAVTESNAGSSISSASIAEDIEIATCGVLRAAHLVALQRTAEQISEVLGTELAIDRQDAQDMIGQGLAAYSRALSANLPAVTGPDRHLHVLRAASLISQQLDDAEVLRLLELEFRHLPGWDSASVLAAGHALHQSLIQAAD